MKINVALPTTSGDASPESIRMVAVEAERRGWETVWTVERLLCPDPAVAGASYPGDNYQVVYDPLESIVWAAAHTSTLRFGTSVLDALFHPPVTLGGRHDLPHERPDITREHPGHLAHLTPEVLLGRAGVGKAELRLGDLAEGVEHDGGL